MAALFALGVAAFGQRHIWSKQSTIFDLYKLDKGALPPSKRMYSPDHTKYLELSWSRQKGFLVPYLSLVTGTQSIVVPYDVLWVEAEALWSPDSKSFSLTGNLNGYTNSTRLFRTQGQTLQPISIVRLYQDMARAYPPCRASRQFLGDCRQFADGADFNYATVAWASPATAIIMGEVPCDSIWGGIMCDVEAYEFDTTTQAISARMSAQQFQQKWQPSLAWKFRVPDPPIWDNSSKKARQAALR